MSRVGYITAKYGLISEAATSKIKTQTKKQTKSGNMATRGNDGNSLSIKKITLHEIQPQSIKNTNMFPAFSRISRRKRLNQTINRV